MQQQNQLNKKGEPRIWYARKQGMIHTRKQHHNRILIRLFRIKIVASSRVDFGEVWPSVDFFDWCDCAVFKVAGERAKKATSDPDVNPELISNKKRVKSM